MPVGSQSFIIQKDRNQVIYKTTWFSFLPATKNQQFVLDLGDRFNDVRLYVATPYTFNIYGQTPGIST